MEAYLEGKYSHLNDIWLKTVTRVFLLLGTRFKDLTDEEAEVNEAAKNEAAPGNKAAGGTNKL